MIANETYSYLIKRKATPLDAPNSPVPDVNATSFVGDHPPNIFYVEHVTSYRYEAPVQYSKHLLHLQPAHDLNQSIINYQLKVSSNCDVWKNFTGVFGNHATFLEIKEPYTELKIESRAILSVSSMPKKTDFSHQSLSIPLIWMPWDRVMMNVYLQPPELPESELFVLADYASSFVKKNNYDILEVLEDINSTIKRDFFYVKNETSVFTTPYQVLMNRRGVCQDFANLFICLARLLHVPARYRMGYLHTGAAYANQFQYEGSHAWAECYLPYIGWIGFDPTNGCLADNNHIRVACGRNFSDATPTSGTLFMAPGNRVNEMLSTSVQVHLLNL